MIVNTIQKEAKKRHVAEEKAGSGSDIECSAEFRKQTTLYLTA